MISSKKKKYKNISVPHKNYRKITYFSFISFQDRSITRLIINKLTTINHFKILKPNHIIF